ncbi:MAG: DUF6797 domain-containing protein [Verrucomicrobiota bacterium]
MIPSTPHPLLALTVTLALATLAHAKEPPNAVDHAGIIQSFDDESFAAGETIYQSLCTNCHGADGVTPPLPTARAFGSGELKFGADPYAMFQTLTNGNGLMGAQTWMTPEERYNVIHYIREKFMRPLRDDFEEIHDGYLEALPTVNVVVKESDTVARNFGPALASQLGRDLSSALTVKLNNDTTISYNLHTMDTAGVWSGGFLNLLNTQHYRERGGGVAEPDGTPVPGLQTWKWGHDGTLDYPTDKLLPRGPLPSNWLNYFGHFLHNDRLFLAYEIDGRSIYELPSAPRGFNAIQQTLEIGPGNNDLKLCVGELPVDSPSVSGFLNLNDRTAELKKKGPIAVLATKENDQLKDFLAASIIGAIDGLSLSVDDKNRLVLHIPAAGKTKTIQVIRHAGEGEGNLLSFAGYLRAKLNKNNAVPRPSDLVKNPAKPRWPETLTTTGTLGDNALAYALDTLTIPPNDAENPYNTWFRTSDLAFFPDGRMVVCTHGGDVWIVSGIDDSLENLEWKRFAAGLYEPFGLQVIDDLIYVTCKDRITRLHDFNGNGEADFYESFSADEDVSTFFHAFNFDLQRDDEGNLYYAKAGQYTSYALPGSVVKVSPDGTKREIYCTGFRTPNGMGILPDGRPTVSDNQGSWMPASKISLCAPSGFYGYVQTHATEHWAPDGGAIDHRQVTPPDTFDQPLVWMPQDFDNSSGGQLWIDDPRWGPLSGRLLHTSFGKGWLYYMMLQHVEGVAQAAIVKLKLDAITGIHRAKVNPADGQVYAVGLNGWNGGGRPGLTQGGIHRIRYTGTPQKLLTDVKVRPNGLRLDFNFKLDPEAAQKKQAYNLIQWNYLWSTNYGSKQFSLENEWEEGKDEVEIERVVLNKDGRSVFLKIPGLKPVNQVELNLAIPSADGSTLEEQAYLTINKVPGDDGPDMKELTAGRTFLWDRAKKEEEERKRQRALAQARKKAEAAAKKAAQKKAPPKEITD